jgi:6-phosphofructokinase 2
MRIATLTMNPSLDLNVPVDRVSPNKKIRAGDPTREPGGGGLNVSVVAGRLGTDTVAVTTSGGPIGDMLVAAAEAEGIACRPVPVSGVTRENPTFSERESDDQYRFVLPGPTLSGDEWSDCLDVVDDLAPDLLVGSGSLPPGVPDDFYARLARRQKDRSEACRVIIDTSGAALTAAAEEGVFLMKPNAGELAQLCGHELDDQDFAREADRLVASGAAEVLVLSLGAGGAYLARAGEAGMHLPVPTVPIKSRIGAGDSMVAGIVTGLARGWDIVEAVRLGLAAGAAAVMTAGTELARAEDVERLYRHVGDRSWAAPPAAGARAAGGGAAPGAPPPGGPPRGGV